MFLAQFWNHETNSRPFYYSNKMTIQEAPLIFDSFLEFLKIHSLLLSIEHGLSEVTPMSKFAPVDSSCCTHIFICMPIWFADIVSTWKNVNKETCSKPSLPPNFNILYQCLYLRGCPQIHFVFYSGLWPLSSARATSHPPIVDSLKCLGYLYEYLSSSTIFCPATNLKILL